MHPYRTHNCAEIREKNVGEVVRLSGWVHRKRDHGNLLFVDLRDHFGLTQCVVDSDSPVFNGVEAVRQESVIMISGKVVKRTEDTVNQELPTGQIEVKIEEFEVLGPAGDLPMPVFGDAEYPEDIRLKYRFLDLRREKMHKNIILRSNVIASIRRRMIDQALWNSRPPS